MLPILPLLLLLSIPGQLPTPPTPPTPQGLLDRVAGANQSHGGVVFRVGQGATGLLWEGTSGELVVGGAAMTPGANFEIASTSKAFTAAAALRLVEDGLLDLDAPLSTYWPPSQTLGLHVVQGIDYGPDLTLRQMLQHTTGMGDYWYDPPYVAFGLNSFGMAYTLAPQRFWTPQEVLGHVPALDPWFAPGQGWHYSDSPYVIVGLLMEQVTGLPLETIYRDYLFTPLGMSETWLHWRDPIPPALAQSHRYEGTWDMFTKQHNSADWAGGGLVSTTKDLQKFIHGLASGALFQQPGTLATMQSWVSTDTPGIDYGLGLYRVPLGFGLGEIWGHDGYGNAWMYYWPRHDVTFTGGLNQTENNWWWLVVAAALRMEYF